MFVLVRKSLEFDPPTLKTIPMKLKKKNRKTNRHQRQRRKKGDAGAVEIRVPFWENTIMSH